MQIVFNGLYDDMVTLARAFGCIGPVFYAVTGAGEWRIRITTNGGRSVFAGDFNSEPASFLTDFPQAIELSSFGGISV